MYGVINKLTKQLIVRVIVTVVGSLIRKTAKIKLASRFWSLSATVGQLVGSIGKSDKIKFYSPTRKLAKTVRG